MTTPALEYVVAEAAENGITDVLLVVNEDKRAIADYFRANDDLEAALEKKDDQAALGLVRRAPDLVRIHEIDQDEPQGLGHAVAQGEQFAEGEGIAVLLPDDLIDDRDPLLGHDDRRLQRARWCRDRADRRAPRRDQQVRQRAAHR